MSSNNKDLPSDRDSSKKKQERKPFTTTQNAHKHENDQKAGM